MSACTFCSLFYLWAPSWSADSQNTCSRLLPDIRSTFERPPGDSVDIIWSAHGGCQVTSSVSDLRLPVRENDSRRPWCGRMMLHVGCNNTDTSHFKLMMFRKPLSQNTSPVWVSTNKNKTVRQQQNNLFRVSWHRQTEQHWDPMHLFI